MIFIPTGLIKYTGLKNDLQCLHLGDTRAAVGNMRLYCNVVSTGFMVDIIVVVLLWRTRVRTPPTTISSSPKVHRACVSTDHRPNRVNNLLYNDRGALCILESTTLKYGRHGHGVYASLCRNIGVKTESFSHTISTWDIDISIPQRDKLNTHAHDVQRS